MTTGIEWADETWNPIRGCQIVSEGCANCYAMRQAGHPRLGGPGKAYEGLTRKNADGKSVWTGEVRFAETQIDAPLKWKSPKRIFVCSMSDLFYEGVDDGWRHRIFDVMAQRPDHRFLLLTKRPDIARKYFRRIAGVSSSSFSSLFGHVWLGVSVENQDQARARIPILLDTPVGGGRFISAEPLLDELNLQRWLNKLDWVIAGGESGPDARRTSGLWIMHLNNQCEDHDVPFFFKQWGEWHPTKGRVGRRRAGHLLYGETFQAIPAQLDLSGGAA